MRNPPHLPSLFHSLSLSKLEISIPRQITHRQFFSCAWDCAGRICLGRQQQGGHSGKGAREVGHLGGHLGETWQVVHPWQL